MCRKSRGAAECDAGQARQHHRRICWPGRLVRVQLMISGYLDWGTREPGARTLSRPRRSERLVGSHLGLLCWASWEPALWWRSWSIAGQSLTRIINKHNMAPQNKHKRLRDSDQDTDTDYENESFLNTSANWPRFLVVESANVDLPLSKLLTFAIRKGFQAIAGTLKSIKRLSDDPSGGMC